MQRIFFHQLNRLNISRGRIYTIVCIIMITRIALKNFREGVIINRDTLMNILQVSYMRFELRPFTIQTQAIITKLTPYGKGL